MMCAAAAAAAAGGILPSSSPSMGLGVRVISGAGADLATIGPGMGSCPTPGAQSDCRTRYQLLLSGRALADRYRRIYTTAINYKEQGINQGRWVANVNYKDITDDGSVIRGASWANNLIVNPCCAARQSTLAAPMLFVVHVARASLGFCLWSSLFTHKTKCTEHH